MTVHVGDFESHVDVEPEAGGRGGGGGATSGGGASPPGGGEGDLREKIRMINRDWLRTQAEGYGD